MGGHQTDAAAAGQDHAEPAQQDEAGQYNYPPLGEHVTSAPAGSSSAPVGFEDIQNFASAALEGNHGIDMPAHSEAPTPSFAFDGGLSSHSE